MEEQEYIDTYFSDITLKYHRSQKDLEKRIKYCGDCKKVKKIKYFEPGEHVCRKCKKK